MVFHAAQSSRQAAAVMYVKREKKYDHRVKEWRYFMTLANIKSEDGRIIEDLNQSDRLWAGPIPEPVKGE